MREVIEQLYLAIRALPRSDCRRRYYSQKMEDVWDRDDSLSFQVVGAMVATALYDTEGWRVMGDGEICVPQASAA